MITSDATRPVSVRAPRFSAVLSDPRVAVLVLVASGGAGLALLPGAPGPARVTGAVLLFVLLPGLAWTPVLRLDRDPLIAATSVLMLSLGADVLVAEAVMSLAGLHWLACAAVLLGLSELGAVTQATLALRAMRQTRRTPSREERPS
jgi:membrane-bound ClpP family serine protease